VEEHQLNIAEQIIVHLDMDFLGGNMKKLINITVEALRYIEQKYHHRVYLCDTCEHNENNRCLMCGCFVTAKAAIPTAKCPKGKW
jgi:hypothetical protein